MVLRCKKKKKKMSNVLLYCSLFVVYFSSVNIRRSQREQGWNVMYGTLKKTMFAVKSEETMDAFCRLMFHLHPQPDIS